MVNEVFQLLLIDCLFAHVKLCLLFFFFSTEEAKRFVKTNIISQNCNNLLLFQGKIKEKHFVEIHSPRRLYFVTMKTLYYITINLLNNFQYTVLSTMCLIFILTVLCSS